MRDTLRRQDELRRTVREWLHTTAWAARDGHWRAVGAALVLAASALRWRLSLLGELPAWVWGLAMIVVSAGCGAADVGDDAPIAVSFVSAMGAFAYALRTKVTSDARTQSAVLKAMERYRADAETAGGAARDERRHREDCERRCDILVEDLSALRELLHGKGYRVPPMRSRITGEKA